MVTSDQILENSSSSILNENLMIVKGRKQQTAVKFDVKDSRTLVLKKDIG